jgi:uncharacterized protein YchJ
MVGSFCCARAASGTLAAAAPASLMNSRRFILMSQPASCAEATLIQITADYNDADRCASVAT